MAKYREHYFDPSILGAALSHKSNLSKLLRNMPKNPNRVAAAQAQVIKAQLDDIIEVLINSLPDKNDSFNKTLNSTEELNVSLGLDEGGDSSIFNATHAVLSPGPAVTSPATLRGLSVSPVPLREEDSADGGGGVDQRRKSEGDAAVGNQVKRVIQVLKGLKIGIKNWPGQGENVNAVIIAKKKTGLHLCWPGTT